MVGGLINTYDRCQQAHAAPQHSKRALTTSNGGPVAPQAAGDNNQRLRASRPNKSRRCVLETDLRSRKS